MHIVIDSHDITVTGGLENVVAGLANALVQRNHRVTCLTYSQLPAKSRFLLSPEVNLKHYVFTGDGATIPELQKLVLDCSPDVFVSPASFNNSLLWCRVLKDIKIPLLYSEHSDPWLIENTRWNRKERHALLWAADAIHLLLPPFLQSIPQSLQKKCHVIGNPVQVLKDSRYVNNDLPLHILSLGRLSPVKQIPLLIAAFDLLSQDFPQWELHIWGSGKEESNIRKAITRTSCSDRIHIYGLAQDPHQQFSQADIFCIPSQYEGFGLTIVEAFTHGIPVVGFQECNAVNYLVKSGYNGLLASKMTAASLAQSLRCLMEDKVLRQRMGQAAQISAQEYSPEHIYDQWEQLLLETATCKGNTQLSQLDKDILLLPEEDVWREKMREILRRPNILLQNNQIFRRILRRYPKVKDFIKRLGYKNIFGR